MTPDDLVRAVRELGFPIFVAGYVLIRIEPILREMARCLSRMCALIEQTTPKGGPRWPS